LKKLRVGSYEIFFSAEILAIFESDLLFRNSLTARMEPLCAMVANVRLFVSQRLAIDSREIFVVPVAVNQQTLGFTNGGAIYLNLVPLSGSYEATETSIFMTILHELTHRAHKKHDSAFAQENARLVFKVMRPNTISQ
jgi:WLM domain